MADKKISDLPPASSPLVTTALIEIETAGGASQKALISEVAGAGPTGATGPAGPTGPGSNLTVKDGSTTVTPASTLNFTGATVTNAGSGQANVAVSGGGSGPKFLNLVGSGFAGALDVSGEASLEQANITGTDFVTATFAGCTALTFLNASGTVALTSLDASGATALTFLIVDGAVLLTSLDVDGATSLALLHAATCSSLTALDVSSLTSLTNIEAEDCISLVSLNVSNLVSLIYLDIAGAVLLTSLDVSGATSLNEMYVSNCALPSAAVDAVLVALDANGASNGEVDLSGGTNEAPGAAGLAAKASLEGRGWTVTVTP